MDLFLLIFVLVIIGIAVFINVKLLLYFRDPEDTSGIFVKVAIIISLTLAWLVNLLLPIDVRNSRPVPGPLDMHSMWVAVFITLGVFLMIVVPGVTFYHEVEGDDMVKKKRRHVICNLLLMLFFSGCAVGISFPFLSDAAIPVVRYGCSNWYEGDASPPQQRLSEQLCSSLEDAKVHIKVGFQIYIIAVLCFIGWFFFVTFGGIGLGAVPLDLILEFVWRPQAIDDRTYQQRRLFLGRAAATLVTKSEELQSRDTDLAGKAGWRAARQKRFLKADYNRFKSDTLLLEDEFDRLRVSKFNKGEALAISIFKLVLGILCAILSLAWVFHTVLCVLVPQMNKKFSVRMLDAILMACESSGLYPLGVALFATFTLYLLLCVVKGCMKFGMRIFFLFSVHPMRHQATPLNSMLFNVELLLISSAAVVQFSQTAFGEYARLTDADVIFSAQIKYMTFYSWFFENSVFIWCLLAWFLLTLIYLLVRPRSETEAFMPSRKADKTLAKLIGVKLGKSGQLPTQTPTNSA